MERSIDKHEQIIQLGKLLIVCGRSGAGKTTLVEEAIKTINGIAYLRTYTTRKPRSEEEVVNSFEYQFVTKEQYVCLQEKSQNWDHSEIYDNYYGADIDIVNNILQNGNHLIVNTIPSIEAVNDLKQKYVGIFKVIIIETPKEISNKTIDKERQIYEHHRIAIDDQIELNEIRQVANTIFVPTMNLKKDKIRFSRLVEQLIGL